MTGASGKDENAFVGGFASTLSESRVGDGGRVGMSQHPSKLVQVCHSVQLILWDLHGYTCHNKEDQQPVLVPMKTRPSSKRLSNDVTCTARITQLKGVPRCGNYGYITSTAIYEYCNAQTWAS